MEEKRMKKEEVFNKKKKEEEKENMKKKEEDKIKNIEKARNIVRMQRQQEYKNQLRVDELNEKNKEKSGI